MSQNPWSTTIESLKVKQLFWEQPVDINSRRFQPYVPIGGSVSTLKTVMHTQQYVGAQYPIHASGFVPAIPQETLTLPQLSQHIGWYFRNDNVPHHNRPHQAVFKTWTNSYIESPNVYFTSIVDDAIVSWEWFKSRQLPAIQHTLHFDTTLLEQIVTKINKVKDKHSIDLLGTYTDLDGKLINRRFRPWSEVLGRLKKDPELYSFWACDEKQFYKGYRPVPDKIIYSRSDEVSRISILKPVPMLSFMNPALKYVFDTTVHIPSPISPIVTKPELNTSRKPTTSKPALIKNEDAAEGMWQLACHPIVVDNRHYVPTKYDLLEAGDMIMIEKQKFLQSSLDKVIQTIPCEKCYGIVLGKKTKVIIAPESAETKRYTLECLVSHEDTEYHVEIDSYDLFRWEKRMEVPEYTIRIYKWLPK